MNNFEKSQPDNSGLDFRLIALPEHVLDQPERPVERMFALCDELRDRFGISCDPVNFDPQITQESSRFVSSIAGPQLTVAWGFERKGEEWSAFIQVSVDEDIQLPEVAKEFILRKVQKDLEEQFLAFCKTLVQMNRLSINFNPV